MAAVLEVDDEIIDNLIRQDQREYLQHWLRWVNTPVPMVVRRRRLPMFVGVWEVPEYVTTQEEAERWACQKAMEWGPLVLHVSRKVQVAIDEQGRVTGRYESSPDKVTLPYQQLGRHKFRFVMGPEKMAVQMDGSPKNPTHSLNGER